LSTVLAFDFFYIEWIQPRKFHGEYFLVVHGFSKGISLWQIGLCLSFDGVK
jgi:hypothetical protein